MWSNEPAAKFHRSEATRGAQTDSYPWNDREMYPLQTPAEIVGKCQKVMAHAWMVRTFIKHADEAEDFPELMEIVRAVFDTSRALETRVNDPAAYLKMLAKKLGKLKAASAQFRQDAPVASTHTNFQQAVISMEACCEELDSLLQWGQHVLRESQGSSPPSETPPLTESHQS